MSTTDARRAVRRRVIAAAPPMEPGLRAEIAGRLGYAVADEALLAEALTHASASGRGRRARRSNERLEFLGDRVLGLIMAHALIELFPDETEGALSRRHAALVRRETLAEIALELGVGEWLTVARSEEEGGRSNPAILANTLEALIGAIYLDGGLVPAMDFVRRNWRERMLTMAAPPRDAKTGLQEWAQARGMGLPSYEVVEVAGPPHAPTFEVRVRLEDGRAMVARAGSKRAAEQAAAARLLELVAGEDDDGHG